MDVSTFQSSLRGELLQPGDGGYDEARRVWNGMIDRRPALIARCAGVADVRRAIAFARENNLLVAVRGGGHNIAGHAVCDGGIVIDLSRMKGIRVDPLTRTARAQAGLTWGEFDHETQAFGLATTGGAISTTGIAGLTLGGGIGWLMRKHGLTCDNLLAIDLVTADGAFVTASATENADLFWGVCGGGGNFGIVTEFEYQLHPVETVLAGILLYPAAKAAEVLRFYRDTIAGAPDELSTILIFLTVPPAPFLPEALHGQRAVAIAACYAGSLEDGEEALQPFRDFGPPLVDMVGPMPYTVLQTMFDAMEPAGLPNYWKSDYLRALSDAVIETIVAGAAGMTSPLTQIHVHQFGGAVARVGEEETAVGHRTAPFLFSAMSMWTEPGEYERHIRWTREIIASMQSYTAGGGYVNYQGEEGEDRVRAAYGATKYERLTMLKQRWDPENLFRLNQNVKPE